MKKTLLIALLFITSSSTLLAKDIAIDRPPFSTANQTFLEVEKIIISDTSTEIKMVGYSNPGGWMRISENTSIEYDGKTHTVKSATGITIGEQTYSTREDGEHHLSLFFDPIPKETKQITFRNYGDFIKDIELQSQTVTTKLNPSFSRADKEKALNPVDDGKPLSTPELIDGEAIIEGQIYGYAPELNAKIEIYVDNPLTRNQEKYEAKVDDNGLFTCKIPLISSSSVLFRTMKISNYIVVSPKKKTSIHIDLQEKACQEARLRIDKCEKTQYVYFTGENAELNNQLLSAAYKEFSDKYAIDYSKLMQAIVGMSAEQYRDYLMNHLQNTLEKLETSQFTRKAKEYMKLDEQYDTFQYISMGDHYLQSAYERANNDSDEGYIAPNFSESYYSVVKELPINDPISLYSHNYASAARNCSRSNSNLIITTSRTYPEIFDALKKEKDLSADDLEAIDVLKKTAYENYNKDSVKQVQKSNLEILHKLLESDMLKGKQINIVNAAIEASNASTGDELHNYNDFLFSIHYILSKDSVFTKLGISPLVDVSQNFAKYYEDTILMEKVKNLYEKHGDFLYAQNSQQEKNRRLKQIIEILGTDRGLVFDIINAQSVAHNFERYTPLNDSELKELEKMDNPFFTNYLRKCNDALIAKREEEKKNPYNVYTIPETEDEKILHEIIKPFEGKVVFIDFWATWCGPCLSAMKDFADTKKTYKNKDVVFVYLTDHTSPIKAWENMIPSIGSEHYRLENEQFNYLKNKFGIRGIPSYLILNKKGEQVYFKTGFEGASVIQKILDEELEK